tara:strand:+ start:29 stop:1330 length:1302 start_codon:yes stop_codon:yes gene_type:complete
LRRKNLFDDPTSANRFSMMDWAMLDVLPCRLNCNKLIRYHHIELSDGYWLHFPVNPQIEKDPEFGDNILDDSHDPTAHSLIPEPELMHFCQFDMPKDTARIMKKNARIMNGIAFAELTRHFEAEWTYLHYQEIIENYLEKIRNPKENYEEEERWEITHKSSFDRYPGLIVLDAVPNMEIEEGELEAKEYLNRDLNGISFPILTLMNYYIIKKSWEDVLKLFHLQEKIFQRFFDEYPESKKETFSSTWEKIRFEIYDRLAKQREKPKLGTVPKHIHGKRIQTESNEYEKARVNELVDKIEFKLKNYIRNKIPNWESMIPFNEKNKPIDKEKQKTWGKIADETRTKEMKRNQYAKERKDLLDWLSFGQALSISRSDITIEDSGLVPRLSNLVDYRNSDEKGHPYETKPATDSRKLGWIELLCEECDGLFKKSNFQ